MNRQLIFVLALILFVLPWPHVGIPNVIKLVLIDFIALIFIFQAMKRSARIQHVDEKR